MKNSTPPFHQHASGGKEGVGFFIPAHRNTTTTPWACAPELDFLQPVIKSGLAGSDADPSRLLQPCNHGQHSGAIGSVTGNKACQARLSCVPTDPVEVMTLHTCTRGSRLWHRILKMEPLAALRAFLTSASPLVAYCCKLHPLCAASPKPQSTRHARAAYTCNKPCCQADVSLY